MSLPKLVTNYTAFNEWANQEICSWLKTIDKNLLYANTPSSFSTFDHTLQHMLRAQKFWLLFICEEDFSHLNWNVLEIDAYEIMEQLNENSAEMKRRFSEFTEEELLKTLKLDMPWLKNQLSRYEYIIHVGNHGTFHRGQIITMLRCLGISEGIVNTDYNRFNSL
jgi:uncharacterized damage-inducible protein DinB